MVTFEGVIKESLENEGVLISPLVVEEEHPINVINNKESNISFFMFLLYYITFTSSNIECCSYLLIGSS